MAESIEGTKITSDNDPSIIDHLGTPWSLDVESGLIVRDGVLQRGISHVDELRYISRTVWAHCLKDQSWYINGNGGRWYLTSPPPPPQPQGRERDNPALQAAILKLQNAMLQGFQEIEAAGKAANDEHAAMLARIASAITGLGDTATAHGVKLEALSTLARVSFERIGNDAGDVVRALGVLTDRLRAIEVQTAAAEAKLPAIAAELHTVHQHVHTLPVTLATLASGIEVVQEGIGQILACQQPRPDTTPVSVRFVVPYQLDLKTRERIPMATQVKDDVISVIPLEFDNAGGSAVPPPSGGTATVSIDNPALTVAMGADAVTVEVTPVQPAQLGAIGSITYTDTLADGTVFTATLPDVTIALDAQAVSVHFRTDQITTKPLPAAVPPAPTPDPAAPAANP